MNRPFAVLACLGALVLPAVALSAPLEQETSDHAVLNVDQAWVDRENAMNRAP